MRISKKSGVLLFRMGRKLKGRQITGKGLKGALQHHLIADQAKLNRQQAAKEDKERKEQKEKSIKGGGRSKRVTAQIKKAFIPFEPSDTVLLVGEGDFSFACSAIREKYVSPENLIATSYDSREELDSKYPGVEENLKFLQDAGVNVLHDIDATNLAHTLKLSVKKNTQAKLFNPYKRLNHIMFNFPHTGRGMKDQDRNIRDHQKLVLAYFKSSKHLLSIVNNEAQNAFGGYQDIQENASQKIILSLFEGEPYVSWAVKMLARGEGLRVERSGKFEWEAFEGYHHKRTNGIRDTTKPAAERDARIYMFDKALTREQYEVLEKKKRKGQGHESDSDDD